MHSKLLIPVLMFAVACNGTAKGSFSSVDNRANAKMRVQGAEEAGAQAEENPSYAEEETRYPGVVIGCESGATARILTRIENDQLIIEAEGNADISSCEVIVNDEEQPVEEIVVTGNGELHTRGRLHGLHKVSVTGGGTIDFESVETSDLQVELSGNGEARFGELFADQVDFSLRGNGKTTVAGAAKDASLDLSGNGEFDGSDFEVENFLVNVSGSGDVQVNATVSADITVSGSSTVWVSGGAEIVTSLLGSGFVEVL